MKVEENVIKKEEITEDDPLDLTETIQITSSSTELMDQDPLEVMPIKKEEIEEDEQPTTN